MGMFRIHKYKSITGEGDSEGIEICRIRSSSIVEVEGLISGKNTFKGNLIYVIDYSNRERNILLSGSLLMGGSMSSPFSMGGSLGSSSGSTFIVPNTVGDQIARAHKDAIEKYLSQIGDIIEKISEDRGIIFVQIREEDIKESRDVEVEELLQHHRESIKRLGLYLWGKEILKGIMGRVSTVEEFFRDSEIKNVVKWMGEGDEIFLRIWKQGCISLGSIENDYEILLRMIWKIGRK